MKISIKSVAFVVVIAVILLAVFTKGNVRAPKAENNQASLDQFSAPLQSDFIVANPGVSNLPKQDISKEEEAGLIYMREEEKLARDVFATLYGGWKLQVFANIAQSENTHTDAVKALLEKYNIEDPVKDDTVGKFTNPAFTKLYTDLIAKGSKSAEEAFAVGALVEEIDIADLVKNLEQTDNDDIKLIYNNLFRASRNHLRSFGAQLGVRGIEYTPTLLSAEGYKSILSTPKETGMSEASSVAPASAPVSTTAQE